MSKPYRHFDLPTRHLEGQEFYVPPKARDPEEIALRQARPAGTLLAEYQRNGIRVAAHVVKTIEDEPDVEYARRVIAPAGTNTDWMGFTRFSGRMRNVRFIPILVPDPFDRDQQPDLLSEAGYTYEDAGFAADALVSAIETRHPGMERKKLNLARRVGHGSLMLACSQLGPMQETTPFVAQSIARQECLKTLTAARTLGDQIGTAPSFAQLADPDSDLSVHIRRTAPAGVYEAFDEATEMYRMPV